MNVGESVKSGCCDIISNLGYELYDVVYKKEIDGMNLTLYIYKEGGITFEDCERVSQAVESVIDTLNPMGDVPYNLNVSSLGLDWPIKTDRDFSRNIGKKVEIKLYSKQDGKKDFIGTLKSWNKETVTVTEEHKKGVEDKTFIRKDIANIVPYIEF